MNHSSTSTCARGLLVVGLTCWLAGTPARGQVTQPQDSQLREETERRLVQLDVSVQGPDDAIRSLTRENFELSVAGRFVEDFTIDRVCRSASDAASAGAEIAVPDEAGNFPTAVIPSAVAPVTFLFYFDQPFLTMGGRNHALEVARELIPELVRGGNRATLVSSGQVLTTYADMETDVDVLIAALDEIEKDKRQWDPTAVSEESRISEVLLELRDRGTDSAAGMARRYQADERWRAEKALRRFSMTIGRLADLAPPKAIVYFADRMRSKPGEHYLSYFSQSQRQSSRDLENMGVDVALAAHAFDSVINEANAHGARLYTVQAEGMTGMSLTAAPAQGTAGTRHITDAESSLVSLARETGGESFLRGVKASKVAARIQEELACLYVVSFDAQGFARDTALAVRLTTNHPRVKVDTRGQVYIQSDGARLTSRLLAAFAAPSALQGEAALQGSVIPTGFEDGKFTALVQIAVAGSPLPGAQWDIGASVVSRDKVREDTSGRVEVGPAGAPVVFEALLTFAPGPYEIALVAHEIGADRVLTGKLEGTWPDVDDAAVTVVPIAVMQPAVAVFLRAGAVKTEGALGQDDSQWLRTDRPTALVSLVCRNKATRGALRVERRLVGASEASFPEMKLDFGDDRCAQVRDVISAGTMTDGEFTYEVKVLRKDEQLAVGERGFKTAAAAGS